MRAAILLAGLLIMRAEAAQSEPAEPQPAPPSIAVSLAGAAETVYRAATQGCAAWDIPDSAARAFRDASGIVHLVASHMINRAATGPDLDHVTHDCRIVFQARGSSDPALLDDHGWLSGFATEDGVTIYALVHNEFHGLERPGLCASAKPIACWRNSITWAVSSDSGYGFVEPAPPGEVVATPPYPYDGAAGRQIGYFNPSGIVADQGFYYALFSATAYRAQAAGVCVMRTNHLADPTSWRGWDGAAFEVRFAAPGSAAAKDDAHHVCAPVGRDALTGPIGGVVRHTPSGGFVAVMAAAHLKDGRPVQGFWAAASADLIHWSAPRLIMATPIEASAGCALGYFDYYPSLLDGRSASRDFDTIGDRAWLYFTRHHLAHCAPSQDRDLMRVPVRLTGI